MTTVTNIAAEWSVAYAVSIKRLDSQFMLCLLRLTSWPNLGNLHGDLVDDLRLICALLANRPMVGFLIARRLKLPVDKTFALLSVMQNKGHIVTVGANLSEVDIHALDSLNTLNAKTSGTTKMYGSVTFENAEESHMKLPPKQDTKQLKDISDTLQNQFETIETSSKKDEPTSSKTQAIENSGDVLNQLWRVLNTDIVMSKVAREKIDPNAPASKEVGDVLSQLWQVLNTDLIAKADAKLKLVEKTSLKPNLVATPSESHFENLSTTNKTFLFDINGKQIKLETTPDDESKDVMGQLWSVLNTNIAFKRQSGIDFAADTSAAKTKEVSEVMSQLWRVLNTEIAVKRQVVSKNGSESLSDTTSEANDKLSKLWRILDAEISLKKKSKTYVMTDSSVGAVKKELTDTSGEAVDRLSKLWQVLNSEITISMPPEKHTTAAKPR